MPAQPDSTRETDNPPSRGHVPFTSSQREVEVWWVTNCRGTLQPAVVRMYRMSNPYGVWTTVRARP